MPHGAISSGLSMGWVFGITFTFSSYSIILLKVSRDNLPGDRLIVFARRRLADKNQVLVFSRQWQLSSIP